MSTGVVGKVGFVSITNSVILRKISTSHSVNLRSWPSLICNIGQKKFGNHLFKQIAYYCSILTGSEHTDPTHIEEAFDEKLTCRLLWLLPKTIEDIQSCDNSFFRQWKYFYQKRFDHVAIDQLNIDLSLRSHILELYSLIHNQLSSDRFCLMIKYAWYSCGYTKQKPSQFQSVGDNCFSFSVDECSIADCDKGNLTTCSWCDGVLHFHYFFTCQS